MAATRQPLLLWQIPDLAQSSTPLPLPAATPAEDDAEITVAVLPAADETDVASRDDPTSDPSEQGYADGWESGHLQGKERGYQEGIAAATEVAQAAVRDQVRHLEAIIARLSAPIAALDAAIEEAVAALALEIARCVIGSETSRSRDYLVRLIRKAVAKVPIELGMVKIMVNPADQNVIRQLAPELEDGNTVVIGDEGIEPGDCLVIADAHGTPVKDMRWRPRGGTSQVDLSLATRWRAVMHALFEGENE
jgi:flagellar assembly protein FliH